MPRVPARGKSLREGDHVSVAVQHFGKDYEECRGGRHGASDRVLTWESSWRSLGETSRSLGLVLEEICLTFRDEKLTKGRLLEADLQYLRWI